MTVKELFLNDIKSLIENDERFEHEKGLTVWIETPDLPEKELIVNPFNNLQVKLDYYNKAYDDNLHLKTNSDVLIYAYQANGDLMFTKEI